MWQPRDHRPVTAAASWARLAKQAGLRAADYRVDREWRKHDRNRDHIVQLLSAPSVPSVVMKIVFRPDTPEEFDRIVLAQRHASERMTKGFARVPCILAIDHKERAMLMEAVPGRTVYDHLSSGDDPDLCLRKAGRWLAEFHSATFTEDRVYRPRSMRDHLLYLLSQMGRGELSVASPNAFRRYAEAVISAAPDYEARKTKSARTHGDMNLRNILLDDRTAFGLDFAANHDAPVGFDIARLLLHYAQLFADIDDIPKGHVLPPRRLATFFEGYHFVKPEDPSVQYLLRVRLLMDWLSQPARLRDRRLSQILRMERIKRIARRALT